MNAIMTIIFINFMDNRNGLQVCIIIIIIIIIYCAWVYFYCYFSIYLNEKQTDGQPHMVLYERPYTTTKWRRAYNII